MTALATALGDLIKREPAIVGALVAIAATVLVGILNGLGWRVAVEGGIEAVVAYFVRQNVTPTAAAPKP